MIREATEADLPAIIEMGAEFVRMAWGGLGIEPCQESMRETCASLISSDDGLLLVSINNGVVRGMIAGVLYGWHFNRSIKTAQELWWYGPECHEANALKAAYEEWAIARGATTIHMAAIDGMRHDALSRLYRAMGYLPSEHIYIRGIQWSVLPVQS